eukprot:comp15372_c1_seq1/m.12281 comp15372_c1_seq1/g.12281  ORF comp15372_c1_seq1/g.12281 comp15372_c1_seq1/m.12281 type:complete len:164 (-) comp15372_c1_seq1:192-683(-)
MNFSQHESTLSRGADSLVLQGEIEQARAMSETFELLNQDLRATLQKLKHMHEILDETEEKIDTWLSIVDRASFYQQLQRVPSQPTAPAVTPNTAQNPHVSRGDSTARDSTIVRLPPKEPDIASAAQQHKGAASQSQTQKAGKSVRSSGVPAPRTKPSAMGKTK